MADKLAEAFVQVTVSDQGLDRGLSSAHSKINRFATSAQGNLDKSLSFSGIGLAAGLGGATAALYLLKKGITVAVDAAIEEEKSQTKLRATLMATGNEVDNNAAKFNKFADVLQDSANMDDDATRTLIAYGLNLGITTEQISDMTQAAIGLSEVTGGDARTSMEQLVKANQGNFLTLQRQLPLLKTFHTAEEKLAYVQKISNQGLLERKAQLDTLGGSMDRLKLQTNELAKEVGGALAPSLTVMAKEATDAVRQLREFGKEMEQLKKDHPVAGAAVTGIAKGLVKGAATGMLGAAGPLLGLLPKPKTPVATLPNLPIKKKGDRNFYFNYTAGSNPDDVTTAIAQPYNENYWNSPYSAIAAQIGKNAANGVHRTTPAEMMAQQKRRIGLAEALKDRNASRFSKQRTAASNETEVFLGIMNTFMKQQIQATGGKSEWVTQAIKRSFGPVVDKENTDLQKKKNTISGNEQKTQNTLQQKIDELIKALDANTKSKAKTGVSIFN